MVSKRELLDRIERLEDLVNSNWKDIAHLERVTVDLAQRLGYTLEYRNGLYLEPVKGDCDE